MHDCYALTVQDTDVCVSYKRQCTISLLEKIQGKNLLMFDQLPLLLWKLNLLKGLNQFLQRKETGRKGWRDMAEDFRGSAGGKVAFRP